MQDLIAATPGTYNVDNSFKNSQPEVEVRLDRIKAPEFGLSLQQVANALADSVAGNQKYQFRDPSDGQQYYIRVQLADADRNNPQTISTLLSTTKTAIRFASAMSQASPSAPAR